MKFTKSGGSANYDTVVDAPPITITPPPPITPIALPPIQLRIRIPPPLPESDEEDTPTPTPTPTLPVPSSCPRMPPPVRCSRKKCSVHVQIFDKCFNKLLFNRFKVKEAEYRRQKRDEA